MLTMLLNTEGRIRIDSQMGLLCELWAVERCDGCFLWFARLSRFQWNKIGQRNGGYHSNRCCAFHIDGSIKLTLPRWREHIMSSHSSNSPLSRWTGNPEMRFVIHKITFYYAWYQSIKPFRENTLGPHSSNNNQNKYLYTTVQQFGVHIFERKAMYFSMKITLN